MMWNVVAASGVNNVSAAAARHLASMKAGWVSGKSNNISEGA